ncbi:AAA family ATPase, partial [Candidatus Altiarchaeota archaeon]
MHLKHLELKGFKSFRDKTILEFPENFTSIVGPNGSGKSNITEAICFVLGKSRGLRAANLQELIYNGGLHEKPAEKAIVKMVLRDEDDEEIKIARMVDQEGNSVYHVNGQRAKRQKIIDIVGGSEYNIILQDDVTKVIDMRPKERRIIIDDLCGIAEYDRKKQQAIKELEKVEKRISDTTLVLGERQGYLGELGKERDQALSYKKLEEDLRRHKASILNWTINSINRKRERVTAKLKELEDEKQTTINRNDEIKRLVVEKNQELKRISQEIFKLEEDKRGVRVTAMRGDLNLTQDRLEALKRRWTETENERKLKEDQIKEAKGELKDANELLSDLSRQLKDVEKDMGPAAEKAGDLELEKNIDETKNKVYEIHSQLETNKRLDETADERITNLKSEQDHISENVKQIIEEEKNLVKKTEEFNLTHNADWKIFEDLKSELSDLNR